MKKAVLVPDSFKGTLTAKEVSSIMREAILAKFKSCEVEALPIADGGEGTVDCFISYLGFKRVDCRVVNHQGEELDTYYAFRGDEVVIEMALAAGITLTDSLKPYTASSYGVGLMIADAIKRLHPKRIYLTLGGSATNDLGIGMLRALGVEFYHDGIKFIPNPLTIGNITSINSAVCEDITYGTEFICMTDVTNPLYGPMGATNIFGPQKGIRKEDINKIDEGFRHFSELIRLSIGKDYAHYKGVGAAGGMGYAAVVFLRAELKPGIDAVLDMLEFDKKISDADYVFTGEGRLDMQSLDGKAISGIARRCKKQNKRLIALCGAFRGDEGIYDLGVSAVYEINSGCTDFNLIRKNARANLRKTMDSILRTLE